MQQTVNHDLSLTFDFLRYLVSHAEVAEALPSGDDTEIVFVEPEYPVELPENMEHVLVVKVSHAFSPTVAA